MSVRSGSCSDERNRLGLLLLPKRVDRAGTRAIAHELANHQRAPYDLGGGVGPSGICHQAKKGKHMGNVSKWEMARVTDAQLHARMDAAAARSEREAGTRNVGVIVFSLFVVALIGLCFRGLL